MIGLSLLLIAGFIALYLGAEWLVRGSASLAKATGIRPVIIALTIVAFGTSAPELVVSVNASIHQHSPVAVGNIIGSMIANMGLILGIAALVKPIKIEFRFLKKEIPILIACELLFLIFAWNLTIGRIEGSILFIGFVLFNWYCIREAKRNIKEHEAVEREYREYVSRAARSKKLNIFLIIIGLAALVGGSHLTVTSAVAFAKIFDISPFIIAASVVAFGTSLPELATSVIAAAKGEFDISVGNVLGSNIFNIFMCIGAAAVFSPLSIERDVARIDTLIMIGLSLLLGLLMWNRLKITRWEGLLLVLAYGGYLVYLYH